MSQARGPGMAPLVGDGVIQFPRPRQVDTCRARVGVEERHRLPQCLAAASCGWWLPARHRAFPTAHVWTVHHSSPTTVRLNIDTLDSLHVTPTIPTIPNILPTAYNSTASYSSLLYRIPSLQHTISSPHIHSIRRSTNTTMFKHLIDQLSQLYPPKPLFTEFELPDLKEKVFPEPSIPPSNSLKNKNCSSPNLTKTTRYTSSRAPTQAWAKNSPESSTPKMHAYTWPRAPRKRPSPP